jgi:hypothetical protein
VTEHLNHHVRIACSRGEVSIPWESREALLLEIRHLDSAAPTVEAFSAVGVSRPVELTLEQKGLLIEVIEQWATQADFGLEGLPDGMIDLRNALREDLRDTLGLTERGDAGTNVPWQP